VIAATINVAREGGEIVPFPGRRGPKRGKPGGGPQLDPDWRKWLRALRQHGPRVAVVVASLAAIIWALNGFTPL
jgi:hypothetical protein